MSQVQQQGLLPLLLHLCLLLHVALSSDGASSPAFSHLLHFPVDIFKQLVNVTLSFRISARGTFLLWTLTVPFIVNTPTFFWDC